MEKLQTQLNLHDTKLTEHNLRIMNLEREVYGDENLDGLRKSKHNLSSEVHKLQGIMFSYIDSNKIILENINKDVESMAKKVDKIDVQFQQIKYSLVGAAFIISLLLPVIERVIKELFN